MQETRAAESAKAHQGRVSGLRIPGCRKCGGPLKIVAYIIDGLKVRRILDLC